MVVTGGGGSGTIGFDVHEFRIKAKKNPDAPGRVWAEKAQGAKS
jgi:hypothetical protein